MKVIYEIFLYSSAFLLNVLWVYGRLYVFSYQIVLHIHKYKDGVNQFLAIPATFCCYNIIFLMLYTLVVLHILWYTKIFLATYNNLFKKRAIVEINS